MADLIGGAAVGLIFSELYKGVENLIEKTKKFSPHLKAIRATVDSLKPVIDQIEEQNKELNLSNEETEKLKKIISDGIKLVGDCSKNPNWYRKASYTDKITDLDEALKRQLEILKAQGLRDGKETLIRVTEIKKLINQLQSSLLQASCLLLVLIVFHILVSRTSSASVPDGVIILSLRALSQLGYFVVSLFGKLLVNAVAWVFFVMTIIGFGCLWVIAFQDQYRKGFFDLKLLRDMIVTLCMWLYLLNVLSGGSILSVCWGLINWIWGLMNWIDQLL